VMLCLVLPVVMVVIITQAIVYWKRTKSHPDHIGG